MTPVSLTMLQGCSEGPIAPAQPLTLLETPATPLPIAEVDEDAKEGLVTERMSEVEQILQDLANGVVDETLPRLTEEDVAFDMDEVVVEEDEILDDNESDMDEDENDIGWIDVEEGE